MKRAYRMFRLCRCGKVLCYPLLLDFRQSSVLVFQLLATSHVHVYTCMCVFEDVTKYFFLSIHRLH